MYEYVEIEELRRAIEDALLEKELEEQVEYSLLLVEAKEALEELGLN